MSFLLDQVLKRFIGAGALDVILPDGRRRRYRGKAPGPKATIHVKTEKALRALLLNSGLAFGEGWMEGEIVAVDCSLEEVLSVLMLNIHDQNHFLNRLEEKVRFFTRFFRQWNNQRRSRANVAHHYDLNGALYDLFLDEDRQYSCGYFTSDTVTLEEAQEAKKKHIAAKLLLDRPGLEVLDIGCGWGGMALTLARDYGAKVTGITLSREQLQVAQERVREAGLESQIQIRLMDYRRLTQKFDRVVSVGMFEHVGIGQYDTYFRKVREVLRSNGVAVIHSIGRMDGPGSTNPWIDRYIFPGGYSPALSEVMPSVERAGLWVTDCEILRLHYAKTLKLWRDRFDDNRDRICALYDERFCRMFEFYLVGAELSFRLQGHMNFQLQLAADIDAVPLTREYLHR